MTTKTYYKKVENMVDASYTHSKKETLEDVSSYPILEIKDRKLTLETCEAIGIRTALSESDGKTPIAHYFPYYDQQGELCGYKKRDLTKEKDEKWHFTAIGKVGVDCKLFGQHVAETVRRKKVTLYVVEGEYDLASAYQAMVENVRDTKFEGLLPFIVSLQCGTANAVEGVMSNEDFVASFDSIALGLDNDFATEADKRKGIKRGKEATEDLAAVLMSGNLTLIEYPKGYKDPSDMVVAGKSEELAKLIQFGRVDFVAEKVVPASSISKEEFKRKLVVGKMTGTFPKLDSKLNGFRNRELTVVTAPSNVGKSTVTAIIAYRFIEQGERTGLIYLEENTQKTLKRIVAQRLGVPVKKFYADSLGCGKSEAEVDAAYEWATESGNIFMVDHFGSLPIDSLMRKVRYLVHVKRCTKIVLDHISLCISGNKTTDERKDLDMVMTELASFCAANDVHIIVVSHINRTADSFIAPKGAEDKPFWVRVRKETLRGSSSLEGLAWNLIGIEPQVMPDRTRGNVRLVVLKNREWDELGEADEFSIDNHTGEIILVESESF